MGGTVYGRGNTTPAAEFNIYADPEAAHVVFSSDIETVVAPWEPCLTHRISGADLDALAARDPVTPVSTLLKALSDQQRARYKRVVSDSIGYVDPLAAALALDPTIIIKSISASVAVSLAPGITRGMTVCRSSPAATERENTPSSRWSTKPRSTGSMPTRPATYPRNFTKRPDRSAIMSFLKSLSLAAAGITLAAGMTVAAVAQDLPTVALVLHGNLGDKSFFDSAAAGVNQAAADLGVEVKIIEAGLRSLQVGAGPARCRRRGL